MRKPTLKGMRKKADDLLTPIVIKLNPRCMLCGMSSQVAHHHVHKSKSTRLRYELDNLIPLCHSCHLKLHHNESYWASVIVRKKGQSWFDRLDRVGQEIVKADVYYYISNFERLTKILQS